MKLKLVVPSNWDDALLDGLSSGVVDVLYAQSNADEYGGGRSSLFLPRVTQERMAAHIRKARSMGIGFNYVLNASCFENKRFDAEFVKRFRTLFDFLCECGITATTISDYMMLKLVKKYYPQLKVSASIFAIITSVSQAKEYEDLGVSDILLGNPNDFEFLKAVRQAVSCDLVIFGNLGCNIFCNECSLHSYSVTHSSQKFHRSKGFYVEHHVLRCSINKLEHPESLLKLMFVRPEDMWLYESIGINKIKIVDRLSPTPLIQSIVKSYAERMYDGNLLSFVNALGIVNRSNATKPSLSYIRSTVLPNLSYLLAPSKINFFRLFWKLKNLKPFYVHIDNGLLDGFKEELMKSGIKCWMKNCAKCGLCKKYFNKAATFYESTRLDSLKSLRDLQECIISSKVFSWNPFK